MTNEEISNLTDEQINVMVTAEVNDISESYHESGENKGKIHQWYSSDELREFSVKDYCNDPAVMWPIMVDGCISVFIEKGLTKHVACVSEWADCAFNIQLETYDENPLRAAAIVYLKIKGAL